VALPRYSTFGNFSAASSAPEVEVTVDVLLHDHRRAAFEAALERWKELGLDDPKAD
jgi:hypothetical protein